MTENEPGSTDGLSPLQLALLDSVRDIAWNADAPAADYAGRQLVRLLCIELGHPLPEPVQRDGGLINVIYGKPIKAEPAPAEALSDADVDAYRDGEPIRVARPIRDQPQA